MSVRMQPHPGNQSDRSSRLASAQLFHLFLLSDYKICNKNAHKSWWGVLTIKRVCYSYRAYKFNTHMRMISMTGETKILPSPISPVRAALHMIFTTVST